MQLTTLELFILQKYFNNSINDIKTLHNINDISYTKDHTMHDIFHQYNNILTYYVCNLILPSTISNIALIPMYL